MADTHRWLHLGLGAFHRAHQAMFLQRLHDEGDTRWRLTAANLRDDAPALLDALAAQHGAYTLETVAPDGTRQYERIEAIGEVLRPEAGLHAIVGAGAHPATRIVSFTVTEAGYHLDEHDRLDTTHPALQKDAEWLRGGDRVSDNDHDDTGLMLPGRTLYGALTALLRRRRDLHAGPLTLLCCDNLRHNGDRSRAGLLQFIEQLCGDPALAAWVRTHTTQPNGMVDRITPRPDAGLPARALAATGLHDAAPVTSERFAQWVIEDRFAAGRPAWEAVGVQMVADVAPYEEAKIRILNASHSGIAWAGTLAGCTFIHEAVQRPAVRQLVHRYVTDDVLPALVGSPIDLAAYRDSVLERFGNAALGDTLARVASDSFAKVPAFLAPTPAGLLAAGRRPQGSAAMAAAFLAFLQRWHEGGVPGHVDQAMDPAVAHAICDAPDPVAAMCGNEALWGGIAGDARWVAAVREATATSAPPHGAPRGPR